MVRNEDGSEFFIPALLTQKSLLKLCFSYVQIKTMLF